MGLIDAITPYAHNLRPHAGGSWTAANCPIDGCPDKGERDPTSGDRLVIWPDARNGKGVWFCRRCGARGDAVDLLRAYVPGMSFPDAWRAVHDALPADHWRNGRRPCPVGPVSPVVPVVPDVEAVDLRHLAADAVQARTPFPPPAPRPLPPELWISRLTRVWQDARAQLRSADASRYLFARGIVPDVAHRSGVLGWIPRDLHLRYDALGLVPADPRRPYFAVPAGLLEVSLQQRGGGFVVVGAAVHRLDRRHGKHWRFPGVAARSVVFRPDSQLSRCRAFVMESSLDAALAWQAADMDALCIAVGSNRFMPDADADAAICQALRPLIMVPDADDAGRESPPLWRRRWPDAIVVEPVGGKDLGDADAAARRGVPGALSADAWMRRVLQSPASSPAPAHDFSFSLGNGRRA